MSTAWQLGALLTVLASLCDLQGGLACPARDEALMQQPPLRREVEPLWVTVTILSIALSSMFAQLYLTAPCVLQHDTSA